MQRQYEHWRDVRDAEWPWTNFRPDEIACRGTGRLIVDTDAMDRLQALRTKLGKPLILRSAYRSPEHNRSIKGEKNSQHLVGKAFDVSMENHDPHAFERAARAVGFTGIGSYPAREKNFIHIDTGPLRTWGDDFPADAPTFSPEPVPVPVAQRPETKTATFVGGAGAVGALATSLSGLSPVVAVAVIAAAVVVALVWIWKRDR